MHCRPTFRAASTRSKSSRSPGTAAESPGVLDTRRFLVEPLRPGRVREEAGVRRQVVRPRRRGPGPRRGVAHGRRADEGRPADVVATLTARPRSTPKRTLRFQIVTDPATRRRGRCLNVRFRLPAGPERQPGRGQAVGRRPRRPGERRERRRDDPAADPAGRTGAAGRVLPGGRRPGGRRPEPGVLPGPHPVRQAGRPEGHAHRRHEHRRRGRHADGRRTGRASTAGWASSRSPRRPDTKYFLKLKSPAGIVEPTKDGFPLPGGEGRRRRADRPRRGDREGGADPGAAGGRPRARRCCTSGAYARGRLIGHQRVELAAGKAESRLPSRGDTSAGGVTRVTVFEETIGRPGPARQPRPAGRAAGLPPAGRTAPGDRHPRQDAILARRTRGPGHRRPSTKTTARPPPFCSSGW